MSETILSVEDAAACLPALVARVHSQREAAVLVQSGRPIARIVPMPAPGEAAADLIAFLRHWRGEHPEPDDQLAADVESSRQGVRPPQNPWD